MSLEPELARALGLREHLHRAVNDKDDNNGLDNPLLESSESSDLYSHPSSTPAEADLSYQTGDSDLAIITPLESRMCSLDYSSPSTSSPAPTPDTTSASECTNDTSTPNSSNIDHYLSTVSPKSAHRMRTKVRKRLKFDPDFEVSEDSEEEPLKKVAPLLIRRERVGRSHVRSSSRRRRRRRGRKRKHRKQRYRYHVVENTALPPISCLQLRRKADVHYTR